MKPVYNDFLSIEGRIRYPDHVEICRKWPLKLEIPGTYPMHCTYIICNASTVYMFLLTTITYHYAKITFVGLSVTYEREVTGSDSTRAKKVSFSASLGWGRYNRQRIDTAGCGPSRD